MHGEADRIGDGVRHPKRLNVEYADLEPILGAERVQLGPVQDFVLAQLAFGEADGQPRAVDGDIELLQDKRQRADVVLVAVGQNNPLDHLFVLQQIGDVRDDQIYPELVRAREGEAAVNDDNFVAAAHGGHVFADFADPAERDNLQGFCAGRPRSGGRGGSRFRRLGDLLGFGLLCFGFLCGGCHNVSFETCPGEERAGAGNFYPLISP